MENKKNLLPLTVVQASPVDAKSAVSVRVASAPYYNTQYFKVRPLFKKASHCTTLEGNNFE